MYFSSQSSRLQYDCIIWNNHIFFKMFFFCALLIFRLFVLSFNYNCLLISMMDIFNRVFVAIDKKKERKKTFIYPHFLSVI